MLRVIVCGLALATAASLAGAQQVPAAFIGHWQAQWQTDRQSYSAELEVTDTGGSWQTATSSRANPCFGRKVPLRHDRVTPNSLDITLMFSDVIQGCKNATVKLQLDDQGKVTGQRSGYDLTLTRD